MSEHLVVQWSGAVRTRARAAGIVYLLFFITAVAGRALLGMAGADGSPSAISADPTRFQVGFGLTLVSIASYVALTGLLYELLRPVSRDVALVAALLSLMGLALQMVGTALLGAPLVAAGQSSLLFLRLAVQLGHAGLVFDGFWLLLLGYLVFRSAILPRGLGALVALAGLGWEVYLAPPLAAQTQTPIEVLGFLAEAALMVWLLALGLDFGRLLERIGVRRAANVATRS
jgi:hypothetical protein